VTRCSRRSEKQPAFPQAENGSMTSLTKETSEEGVLLSTMTKSLVTIGVRLRVKGTKRKEGKSQDRGQGAEVEKRGGAGREARRVYQGRKEVALGAGEASQGVTGVTGGQVSLKREAFQGKGPNLGAEKQADQSVSQDHDQGPKNPYHGHQSNLARIDEDAENSRVHVQDQSRRALKAQKPPSHDRDLRQTRRRG